MQTHRAKCRLICLALVLSLVGVSSDAEARADDSIWFHNAEGLELSEAEAAALVAQIRAMTISGQPGARTNADLPDRLRKDTAPRIVFITVREPYRSARVSMGLGYGITSAIDNSLADMGLSGSSPTWIRLDIVQSSFVNAIPGESLTEDKLGVAFHPGTRTALLYDEFTARGLLTQGRADAAKINAYTSRQRRTSLPLTPAHMINRYRFSTSTWLDDGHGTHAANSFSSRAPTQVDDAVSAALRFLEFSIGSRGQLGTFFGGNRWRSDGNLIRVAHLPPMQQVAALARDQHLQTSSDFLIRRIPSMTEPCKTIRYPTVPGRCLVDWAQTQPTHSALATVALLNSNLGEAAAISTDLGEWLVHQQKPSGEFVSVSSEFPLGKPLPGTDQRFQGWATLALLKLYQQLPQDRWLSAAVRSVSYYIEQQSYTSRSRLVPDLAMLQSIQILQPHYPNEHHRQFMLNVADTLTHAQLTHEDPELNGSFYLQAGHFSTALVAHSLLSTYPFVRDSNEARLMRAVKKTLHNAAAQIVRGQLNAESALFLWEPEAHLGAFGDVSDKPEQLLSATLEDLLFLLEYRAVLPG